MRKHCKCHISGLSTGSLIAAPAGLLLLAAMVATPGPRQAVATPKFPQLTSR